MEFKNILVVLDHSPAATIRLEVAINLARKHQARLAGLYVVSHAFFEPVHNEAASKAEAVEADFAERTARAEVSGHWIGVDWSVVGARVAEIINLHAYYTDLVIVGQEEGAVEHNAGDCLAARVILGSGRPVLIVPYVCTLPWLGERVMVAWKAGRESTRAANDALPLLQKAKIVRVVEVSTQPADKTTHPEQLCVKLALHGVNAQPELVVAADIGVGDALLNRIAVEGDDLLVMGAYGRSRLGTLALGDAATHILRHMTVPVLMSH